MSKETAKLLQRFEALPSHDRQEFALEILRRTRELPLNSGPISDDEIGEAAKALFAHLDRERGIPVAEQAVVRRTQTKRLRPHPA